jgi:hypothetical protein
MQKELAMTAHNIHAGATPRKSRIYHIATFEDRDAWIKLLFTVSACELSGAAKVVAARVALHLNIKTGRCDPSSGLLATECGMDGRSVQRMIKLIEAAGWLGVDRTRGFRSNSFELRTPIGADESSENPGDTTEDNPGDSTEDHDQHTPVNLTENPGDSYTHTPVNLPENPGDTTTQNREGKEKRTEKRTAKKESLPCLDLGDEDGRHRQSPSSKTESFAADFEEWWVQYPKKADKGTARTAYRKVRTKGLATREELLNGAMRYSADRAGQESKFTKNASSWLSAESWNNEPAKPIGATIDSDGNPVTSPPPNRTPPGRESAYERTLRKLQQQGGV